MSGGEGYAVQPWLSLATAVAVNRASKRPFASSRLSSGETLRCNNPPQ